MSPHLVELAFVLLCTALLAIATATALACTDPDRPVPRIPGLGVPAATSQPATPAPLPPTAPPSPSPPEIMLDAGTIVDAASTPDSLLP